MRKRWFACALVLGALVFAYFEPTHSVRGWLHGKTFFNGRPTSFWRGIVERDLQTDPRTFFISRKTPPSWWDRVNAWLGRQPKDHSSLDLLKDEAARPVLRALAADADPTIAAFAADALDPVFLNRIGMMPAWAHVTMDDDHNRWILLLDRHHRKAKP